MTESAGSTLGGAAGREGADPPASLYLASGSLRRREILERLGVSFRVHVPDVNEVEYETDPEATVRVNALIKLRATRDTHADVPIIAADTVLEFDGHCIGKPTSMDAAHVLLRALSGRTHRVLTGVALWPGGDQADPVVSVGASTVRFRVLRDEDISAYFGIVNPLDKAGGYDIDQSGDTIIASVEGSRTNVMGLPLEVIEPWLNQQGLL
ncbi:MAG: Maf family protein [Verrucomicrobia bacterium]|nr:Maf family protein [Verrucomicrobiota bacterium]MDA1088375.1 Maf family protein [Verrucomicrobiota bacterium]